MKEYTSIDNEYAGELLTYHRRGQRFKSSTAHHVRSSHNVSYGCLTCLPSYFPV